MISTDSASTKLSDADARTKLDAIASSGACSEQRVLTLDFSAIERRFGERWPLQRDRVQQKLEKIIEQHAGIGSLWLRMLESEYLCCFDKPAAAAQAISFRVMEDALTHFMGMFDPKDMLVNRVTRIDDATVSRMPVDPHSTAAPSPVAAESRSFAPEWAALTSPQVIPDPVNPLVLSFSFQDMVSVKTETPVGLRIAPRYRRMQGGRPLTTIERASLATPALLPMDSRIAEALPAIFESQAPKTLVVPLSLYTFGNSRGRTAVINHLKRLDAEQRNRLVIELGGFEAGTPSSRLVEAQAVLKPFCRRVCAQPLPSRVGLLSVLNAFLPTLSVSATELGGEGARLASGILAFGEAVRTKIPSLIITDLPTASFLPICNVAGFSLATIASELEADAEWPAAPIGDACGSMTSWSERGPSAHSGSSSFI